MVRKCPHPFRIMKLPNTKGVIFMPKVNLNFNERKFLLEALTSIASELKEDGIPSPTEKQQEFFDVIRKIYDRGQFGPSKLFKGGNFSLLKQGVSTILAQNIDYSEYPDEMKHPKEIMQICAEFAFIYFVEKKPSERDEYFKRFDFIFDKFTVSREYYKNMLNEIEHKLSKEGVDSIIEKYKAMIVDERNAEGKFEIQIPEIHIPAHTIEVDFSDEDVVENWRQVNDKIDAITAEIVAPKSGCTAEEINSVFSNLVDHIYNELIEAEERYEELKNMLEEDEDDE